MSEDTSQKMTDALVSSLKNAIEQVVHADEDVILSELKAYVDSALAPYADLLKKAERLSLTSQSALSTLQQTQYGLSTVQESVSSLGNKVSDHAVVIADVEARFSELFGENQRLQRDAKSALDKASLVQDALSSHMNDFVGLQGSASQHQGILGTIQQQQDDLKQQLDELSLALNLLRNTIALRHGRV